MEQSIDKRLEALEILRRWLLVEICETEGGNTHVKLSDGDEQSIDVYMAYHEAVLLKKAME